MASPCRRQAVQVELRFLAVPLDAFTRHTQPRATASYVRETGCTAFNRTGRGSLFSGQHPIGQKYLAQRLLVARRKGNIFAVLLPFKPQDRFLRVRKLFK